MAAINKVLLARTWRSFGITLVLVEGPNSRRRCRRPHYSQENLEGRGRRASDGADLDRSRGTDELPDGIAIVCDHRSRRVARLLQPGGCCQRHAGRPSMKMERSSGSHSLRRLPVSIWGLVVIVVLVALFLPGFARIGNLTNVLRVRPPFLPWRATARRSF